jgi:hypothetical protein
VALRRMSTWVGACLLVVLATRWLAYELSPAPTALAAELQGVTAPPEPLIVEGTDTGGLFEFTRRSDPGSYTFQVEQTYSDGSVVNWAGPEDAEEPAPIVEMKKSFASGGTSTLAIVALVVGAVALILGAVALVRGGGRELA